MLEIYMASALEPLVINEPMQATMLNMSAAINNNMHFFLTKDSEGKDIAVRIERIDYIKELESEES